MRFTARILLSMISLAATFAYTQNQPNTPIQHIIVVIQENRSPDNLFQDPTLMANGADILDAATTNVSCKSGGTKIPLKALPLANCTNPGHEHSDWMTMYDSGAMDGACNRPTTGACNGQLQYPCPFNAALDCGAYTYVENTPSDPAVQPYWDIAEKYSFSNYTFQTNQGPSFPAHEFLFSGSSVPVYPSDQHYHQLNGTKLYYHDDFVADNPQDTNKTDKTPGDDTGCISSFPTQFIPWIEVGQTSEYTPPSPWAFPCYDHATLTDLLDHNKLSWKYYGRAPNNLWEAPTDFNHICDPGNGTGGGLFCQNAEWNTNVGAALPPSQYQADAMAPILEDIETCSLPAVSWVIPDGSWSDHGGMNSDNKGPAWVSAIVNAVGGPATNECPSGESYWNDTVVLVVWDDWGGYYDHVLPWRCSSSGTCLGYPNSFPNNGEQYVYGFRVPMLVVSAYTKPGYISGKCASVGNCTNNVPPYVHDFGSVLNFIEWALGSGQKFLGEIEPNYHYADYWAPDAYFSGICTKSKCPYSLSDFFGGFATQYTFQPISLPPGFTQYNAEWFEDFSGTPTDPDDDAIDP